MRRVAVLTHSRPSNTDAAIVATARAAERADCEVVVVEREPEAADRRAAIDEIGFAAELPGDVDLCIALGGDGTILRALRRYTGTDVPVFGINYGTIGFLAAVESDELEAGLERLPARRVRVLPASVDASREHADHLAVREVEDAARLAGGLVRLDVERLGVGRSDADRRGALL